MSTLDRFKRIKVLVGVPSLMGLWHEKFAMSLTHMISEFHARPLGNYRSQEVEVASVKGSILPNIRLDLVKRAMEREATHLLFVDTDQTFPRNTLHRLIQADKDVVACNIATKQIPAQPTARLYDPENLWHGKRVYNLAGGGLQKVWRVGCGVMLIRMKVFEKTGLNVWGYEWKEEKQTYQGEDWSFCEACERREIDVWIDHGLSEYVKHIGDFAYDHNVVGETLQEKVANG